MDTIVETIKYVDVMFKEIQEILVKDIKKHFLAVFFFISRTIPIIRNIKNKITKMNDNANNIRPINIFYYLVFLFNQAPQCGHPHNNWLYRRQLDPLSALKLCYVIIYNIQNSFLYFS